jgi:hypothetical protein
METPYTKAGRLTDQIMMMIHEHIRRDPPPQESHHYNRAWSKVLAILQKESV